LLFTAFAIIYDPKALPTIVDRINVRSGLSLIPEDVTKPNQQVLKDERGLNRDVHLTQAHDRFPHFSQKKIEP
jgi:aldehyde:ferredoxin oxidoreductase